MRVLSSKNILGKRSSHLFQVVFGGTLNARTFEWPSVVPSVYIQGNKNASVPTTKGRNIGTKVYIGKDVYIF